MSPGRVRAWLLAAGVQLRPVGCESRTRRDELEALIASGATVREIACRYGLTRTAVKRTQRRYGLESPLAHPPLDEENVRSIRGAYAEGLTYSELAERFVISRSRMTTLTRQARFTPRPRHVVTVPVDVVLAHYDAGDTAPRSAQVLGVKERTAGFWIRKHRRPLPPTLHPDPLHEALRGGTEVRDIATGQGSR